VLRRSRPTGAAWVPSFEDERVLDAFLVAGASEGALRALRLAPGDPDARLAGPELLVQLSVRAGLSRDELDALLGRLQGAWAADPVIVARVDSLGVRVDRV
jgi:hypothetical protein